jgi:hypothetical protein
MPDIKEDLLQFAWQHRLLKPHPLITESGKEIFILKAGHLNRDAGPDFFNAKIRLGEIILAGNIEIHVKTSDWLRHKHQHDRSYDNLILHVVYENDISLEQNSLNNVEVLRIDGLIPDELLKKTDFIYSGHTGLPCAAQLQHVNDFKFTAWLERMFIERLEIKVKYIEALFAQYHGDYLQTFYTVLLSNFGFKINALPFELLAKQLPVTLLLKHADNLLQLEALLLGTAGLLDEQFSDKYILQLQNEFEYLKKKYLITPLHKELFKFSRLRPANFAPLRLAQVALLIHKHPELFSSPQQFNTYEKINSCLSVSPAGYWQHHYQLDGNEAGKDLRLGRSSINIIITNTFVTFFFFYHKRNAHGDAGTVPLSLAEKCAFEKNLKTKLFEGKKHLMRSAADSQALINLYDNYRSRRRCLDCGLALSILSPAPGEQKMS